MPARRIVLIAASVTLAVSTLAGCSGSDQPSKNDDNSTVRPGSDPAENANVAQRYFEAVVSNDADTQSDALEFAAPDSSAAAYLTHLANSSTAYAGVGKERAPDRLTEIPGGYKVCGAGGECVEYSALILADGKLNSFTVGGAAIDKVTVLGKRKPEPLGDLGTVEFLSRSSSGGTYAVNLRVTSGDSPITLGNATALFEQEGEPKIKAVERVGPNRLAANSDAYVTLLFLGSKAAPGSLEYSVRGAGDVESATLRIR
ncbi:hypothetical protein EFK50_07960 [Nocardioides marmoriginsengisoli]|uniref:Lipoprotein n=1 Tax=Nocardioides marmoriginsengisoli TaxID=661483 RepID=A0A3N0CJZ9_9ACTN|nr:hypothetical protein [Nocardioides marmoriginsengisoli]RNL63669.1 hypothetical protein EFK50_07960 [Nocardioides marmoriginsengisoli]